MVRRLEPSFAVAGLYVHWASGLPAGSGATDGTQMDASGTRVEKACAQTAPYVCEEE